VESFAVSAHDGKDGDVGVLTVIVLVRLDERHQELHQKTPLPGRHNCNTISVAALDLFVLHLLAPVLVLSVGVFSLLADASLMA
jgi:hypothetical protein